MFKIFLVKKLTVEEVMAQVFVFFNAGFSTSAAATSLVLFELAKHKDILQKVQTDIDNTLAKHNNEWTYDCIQDMKYLEQVFEETLRLYPPAPALVRSAGRDYKIPGTNVIIEKGTQINIIIMGLHRDPKYFPNPMKFDPDRFSPEEKAKRLPFSYLPFGDGPRSCIGMRYAQLLSKIGLASILSKFNVDMIPGHSREVEFSRTSLFAIEGGLPLKITGRT